MERNLFISKRPNVTIDTAAPARSPMHDGAMTPQSVADTATPQLRQESNYSCFSMATPTVKATPLRNGRWADEEAEWATHLNDAPLATEEQECGFPARTSTEVFQEAPANVCEEPEEVAQLTPRMERAASTSSLASAASHVSLIYRHNPYNLTAGMDELHRCDCDQCSAATTPRNNSDFAQNNKSPASFYLSEPNSTIYQGDSSVTGYTECVSQGESPTSNASAFPSFNNNGSSASLPPNAPSPAAESAWDRSYSDGPDSTMFSCGASAEYAHHYTYDTTSFAAQQLAMPVAPQGQLLKAWVPPPPPPRITARILSDGKPDLAMQTDPVLSRILQRWYQKVTSVQDQFLNRDQLCPAPEKFDCVDSWVAEIGTWWHKHFEDAQKKVRHDRHVAPTSQPHRSTHSGSFTSHASSVPQPRSVSRANVPAPRHAQRTF